MTLPEYKPHLQHDARVKSAKLAIEAILPLDLYLAHKKELLSVCFWKITEADGKWKVRYWSEGAISSDKKTWRHEHVNERIVLINRLLDKEPVENVISDAIACIVTKDEHTRLGQSDASGWARYDEAGIKVYDSKTGEWIR